MAHAQSAYDSDLPMPYTAWGDRVPWTGLAATYWDNRTLAGGTPSVDDDRDGTTAHGLVALNPTSASLLDPALPFGLTDNNWSARYTGELAVTTAGIHGFALSLTGGGQLFVDDTLVIDATGNRPTTTLVTSPPSAALAVGLHRIRLDYETPTVGAATLALQWTPPGGSSGPVPAGSVAPRYSLATASSVDDRPTANTTRVSATTYGSPGADIAVATGLASSSTSDVGGLGLHSQMAYLDPAGLLRPSASYLPGADPADDADPLTEGVGTNYSWWAPSDTSAGTCTGAADVEQAGALKELTQPKQGSGARRSQSYVYDWAGRTVESTIGGASTCVVYDGRGRVLSAAHPAHTNTNVTPNVVEPARTVTYDYAVGGSGSILNDGNPLVSSVTDPAGTITTTVDLLGRVVSYRDVWGQTSTYSYDQPGRLILSDGPAGRRDFDYDNAGRLENEYLNDPGGAKGPSVSNPTYTNGDMTSAVMANSSTLAVTRDGAGATASLTWAGLLGSAIATDAVSRSQTGRVVNETIDGTDARTGADNFVYDGSGRLTEAWVPGQALTYGYGTNGAGCAFDPVAAGRNGNRTSMSVNGGTPTTYCHDGASRLVSSSDTAVGSPSYDARGNTTVLGPQKLLYDGADRHSETRATGGATVRYARDATDRIVSRTEGASVVRYGFGGPGDSSSFTMDATNTVLERSIALGRGHGLQAGRPARGQRRVELPQHPRRRRGHRQHRRPQAGLDDVLRSLRRGSRLPRHRQLALQLRLRLARPAPAGHRTRRRHRHHRDGRTPVCAGPGAIPRGGSRGGRVVQRLRLHVWGSGQWVGPFGHEQVRNRPQPSPVGRERCGLC